MTTRSTGSIEGLRRRGRVAGWQQRSTDGRRRGEEEEEEGGGGGGGAGAGPGSSRFLGTSAKGSAALGTPTGGRREEEEEEEAAELCGGAPIQAWRAARETDLLLSSSSSSEAGVVAVAAAAEENRCADWLALSSAMGCLQSIACKPAHPAGEGCHHPPPPPLRPHARLTDEVSASVDQCPTVIEENSPIVLRYKTPYFRASAGIVMPPVPRNETWVVGWIQACTQMEFYNTYGDIGFYPWYGNTTETVTLTGPTSKASRLTVCMNDNFYPSVTWAVPISNSNTPMLTHITRDQSFITWLVAMNAVTKENVLVVCHQAVMRCLLAYFLDKPAGEDCTADGSLAHAGGHRVDPERPLGARASLVGRGLHEQPHILNYQEPIPPNALGRPNANDAQVLMWRRGPGPALVVIATN
ncbi:hypothetical protein CRUP_033357 [Coryphaenoides rupestris]|nr:hypothetical protein CRUP_033357 [Coryphaenoides rupestris]